jgi:hypothetical protein
MSNKAKPERKREGRPAENKTGDNAQRNKDDRAAPSDDKSSQE